MYMTLILVQEDDILIFFCRNDARIYKCLSWYISNFSIKGQEVTMKYKIVTLRVSYEYAKKRHWQKLKQTTGCVRMGARAVLVELLSYTQNIWSQS